MVVEKKKKEKKYICKVKDKDRVVTDQNEIKNAFYKYVKLFKSKQVDKRKTEEYIDSNPIISSISNEIKQILNQDIATEEIFEAIGDMKLGKSPRTDGITSKFY